MSLVELLLIPMLFGLVGFIEPCSLGANMIFLNKVKEYAATRRVREVLLFTFTRGLFLASVGLTAAFLGQQFITIQTNLFLVLGGIYVLLGILAIVSMYHPLLKELNLSERIERTNPAMLGVAFGLVIPACAIAFVLALIGKAAVVGSLWQGFISLFVFGVFLSSPLLPLTFSERSNNIVRSIYRKTTKIRWLAGAVLILVGLLTTLTSVWWAGAS